MLDVVRPALRSGVDTGALRGSLMLFALCAAIKAALSLEQLRSLLAPVWGLLAAMGR